MGNGTYLRPIALHARIAGMEQPPIGQRNFRARFEQGQRSWPATEDRSPPDILLAIGPGEPDPNHLEVGFAPRLAADALIQSFDVGLLAKSSPYTHDMTEADSKDCLRAAYGAVSVARFQITNNL